ncbi:MAG: phage tail sheath subtilisin-like domain-containing protein [Gammaproteobacteria bacterium]
MLNPSARAPGLEFEVARPEQASNPLRTDIAGFAGPTERGPVGALVRVESWRDYVRQFGDYVRHAHTPLGIHGYFDNGGEIAHVLRTAGGPLASASGILTLDTLTGTQQWSVDGPAAGGFTHARYTISGKTPGAWANDLAVTVQYERVGRLGAPQVDVIVTQRRANQRAGASEALRALGPASLVADVNAQSNLIRVSTLGPPASPTPHPGPLASTWTVTLSGGSDRAPTLADYNDAATRLFDEPEVALVAFVDLHRLPIPAAAQRMFLSALAARAEVGLDRQVIASTPPGLESEAEVSSWTDALRLTVTDRDARNLAVYHPWLEVVDPLGTAVNPHQRVSPVGHVAGAISRLDRERGAHHTPANAPLFDAVDVAEGYDSAGQGQLNALGINLLRCQSGHGLVLWGGRTQADAVRDPENLYIAHRRLVHRLVRAIRRVAVPLVFNSNGPALRFTLVRAITSVLLQAFRAGALKGELPEEAFRVTCDETNNLPADVDRGFVNCEIQVAPAVPMEFIKLRIALSSEGFLELIQP